jgi:predicted RNA-binding protein associated with RNAse of E/G family
VLKYVIDQEYDVHGIKLHPGDVTHALYWSDRPYTLYIWRLSKRSVYYFNIADSIALTPAEFVWRDLAVDILIDVDRKVHVLDEHELPDNLSPELLRYIQRAKNAIMREHPAIIQEAEAILSSLSSQAIP